jgi:hypothetical protein
MPALSLKLVVHLCHELAAAEDSFVGEVVLPASSQIANGHPASKASDKAATLQLRTAALCRSSGSEGPVGRPGSLDSGSEEAEYLRGGLPRAREGPHQGSMSAPRVTVQSSKVADDASAERIEVKIADKL